MKHSFIFLAAILLMTAGNILFFKGGLPPVISWALLSASLFFGAMIIGKTLKNFERHQE